MQVRRSSLVLLAVGVALQLAGLGLDVQRHLDPDHGHEKLFDWRNVPHNLLLTGLLLVFVGAVSIVIQKRRLVGAGLAALVGALAVGTGATALVDEPGAPAASPSALDHHAAPGAAAPGAAAPAGPSAAEKHDHGEDVSGSDPLAPNVRAAQAAQLVEGRGVAVRYATVADAEAAGYRKITLYYPKLGAHYIKLGLIDSAFDVAAPEMLLYDGTDPASKIVGLSYYVRSTDAPEGFAGSHDHWHRHLGLCIDPRQVLVVGGSDTTDEECRRLGGQKFPGTDGWMVHAWVVPGWESARGVFSSENPALH